MFQIIFIEIRRVVSVHVFVGNWDVPYIKAHKGLTLTATFQHIDCLWDSVSHSFIGNSFKSAELV